MTELYAISEVHSSGMLDVGDGNFIYWEKRGNPTGKPALVVHGGPGQGSSPSMSRGFNPEKYCIVLFDQRGCGKSIPSAFDLSTDMSLNTSWKLIQDMEKLRVHLKIETWLLCGSSWGTALSLAYAINYPAHVSEMVLMSVTNWQKSENEWLYERASIFFPQEYQEFRNGVSESDRNSCLVSAYVRLLENPDSDVRTKAAIDWCRWEDAVVSLEPPTIANAYSDRDARELVTFVRICAHYTLHHAWFEEGYFLNKAHKLSGIPGVIIHGRQDLSCPFIVAWELAKAWKDAKLVALSDSGHLGTPSKRKHLLEALDNFSART